MFFFLLRSQYVIVYLDFGSVSFDVEVIAVFTDGFGLWEWRIGLLFRLCFEAINDLES